MWQRSLARDVLENVGYDVIEAACADEAIAVLEARKDVHVVFTDIEMPGSIDGLKLANAIRNLWPPIELIITSGHHRLNDDQIPARAKFLPKPYAPGALAAAFSPWVA